MKVWFKGSEYKVITYVYNVLLNTVVCVMHNPKGVVSQAPIDKIQIRTINDNKPEFN